MRALILGVIVCSLSLTARVSTQWDPHSSRQVPRTPTGSVDLEAPASRTSEGRPDLSGVWELDPRTATRGPLGGALSPFYVDITAGSPAERVPFLPWAAEEYKRRRDRLSIDDPAARCQPYGIPAANAYPAPFKMVHSSGLVLILYEANTTFRQIFTDGRNHPRDPQPTWMGYSVGRWEGDTLVVDTVGFNDRSWLDRSGHPHTDAMRVRERFTRQTIGRLEIEMTVEDPKAYSQPITFIQRQVLLPDAELIEHFCTDNEKFGTQAR